MRPEPQKKSRIYSFWGIICDKLTQNQLSHLQSAYGLTARDTVSSFLVHAKKKVFEIIMLEIELFTDMSTLGDSYDLFSHQYIKLYLSHAQQQVGTVIGSSEVFLSSDGHKC